MDCSNISCTNIPLVTPLLGYVFYACSFIVANQYLLAIILFTIVTRAITLPLAIKQQKGTITMARLKPKTDALNKKYGKDKTKLNEETMKLYKEEGYNPAAGCLPMLVQMVLLFGLIGVIYNPLQYALHVEDTQIENLNKATVVMAKGAPVKANTMSQLTAVNDISTIDIDEIVRKVNELNKEDSKETLVYTNKVEKEDNKDVRIIRKNGEKITQEEAMNEENIKEFKIDSLIKYEKDAKDENGEKIDDYSLWVKEDSLREIQKFSSKLKFFGINFGETPKVPFMAGGDFFNLLWLIPVLSAITAFLTSFITQKINPTQNNAAADEANPMASSMKTMIYIMPIMSLFFAFSVPAGVGFYWICSNVISIGQSLLLNKLYNPKKVMAEIAAKEALKPKKPQPKKEEIEKKIEVKSKDLSDFDE